MILEKTSRFQSSESYKELPHLNYSAIKDFDENRNKFYRRYVLKEYVEDRPSDVSIFGDLVHCLLLTPQEVDNKFTMMTHVEMPKPQMKALVEELWEVTKNSMTDGQVTRTVKDMLEEALLKVAYNSKGERVMFKGKEIWDVLPKFETEGMEYYKKLRDSFGKPVISLRTRENAERLVTELHANPVTKDIFIIKTDRRYEVFNELEIVYEYEGRTLKSKLDKVIVDHQTKTIDLYDLKCTWNFELGIVKEKYYLQWTMYYIAVKYWAREMGLEEYTITPMQFIVVSQDMNENPLVYTTSMKDISYGLTGFTLRSGRKYKGLNQLLTEIAWHYSFGVWNMSYTDYANNGRKKVSLFEEIS